MQASRAVDAKLAIAASLPLPIVVLLNGDPLYLGLWYYLVLPAGILGLCAAFRVKPLFLLGTAFAIAVTLLAVMSVNWLATRPEGLLGLGHIFSLPGAVIGSAASALLTRRNASFQPASTLLLAFFGLLCGYFINQLVVCNTVMWCGPLSLQALR
jgi:hypothetical protein